LTEQCEDRWDLDLTPIGFDTDYDEELRKKRQE